MSVHHIERPPEVAVAIHSIDAQFVFWQFRMQPVELGYSDSLSNLDFVSYSSGNKSAGKGPHVDVR